MGRKSLPTKLKLLKGTMRPGRINKTEPMPGIENIKMPEHLSQEAQDHWNDIVSELVKAGVMSSLDSTALGLLCDSYARYIEATDNILKYGAVYKTEKNYQVISPFVAIQNKSFDQLKSMCTEFGMTPSSRSKVHAEQLSFNMFDEF